MQPNEVKAAVGHFLDLAVNGRGSEAANIASLEVALDMLAWVQQVAQPTGEPDETEYPEPPGQDYSMMRMLVAAQYPSFGPYPVATADETEPITQCDAIDDLTTIAHHLYGIAWRFQNTSEPYALHVFRHGYRTTWRSHLRALQGYLQTHHTERL